MIYALIHILFVLSSQEHFAQIKKALQIHTHLGLFGKVMYKFENGTMHYPIKYLLVLAVLFFQFPALGQYKPLSNFERNPESTKVMDSMLSLLIPNQNNRKHLQYLEDTWTNGYIPMLLDVIYLSRGRVDVNPMINLLREKTGKRYRKNIFAWLEWMWNQDPEILPFHGDWMARIYKNIDPKFEKYFFNRTQATTVRLDEVRWGGVVQDGIPPLRNPEMLSVEDADYLDDDNIVFGISINGDHRAYPKRILAWHEMFVDEIGGESIAGVYCTLCGTVIAYNTKLNGKNYELGTSGFLYRSNKLMYDKATQSLWNTIEGKPVIGPLINSGIELSSHSVVTTTWGAWKKLHPDTKVLSLETGHRRNYDEGIAYKEYFSSDRLMFNVPKLDDRLLNKEEVLIVRADGYQKDPLAISAPFLRRNKIYHDKIGNTSFVVITDRSGANRVYASKEHIFKKILDQNAIKDNKGQVWQITESQLITDNGETLQRLPYHRMFWFAWFNTYENTRLVD